MVKGWSSEKIVGSTLIELKNYEKNLVEYCKMKNVQIVEVDSSQEFNERYLISKLVEIRKFNKKEKCKKK